MQITRVQEQKNSYLVNDSIFVPNSQDNSDYQAIQKWIAGGGIVDYQFTLDDYKENKISLLKSKRTRIEEEIISKLKIDYNGVTFYADEVALTQFTRVIKSINIANLVINSPDSSLNKINIYQSILNQLLPIDSNSKRYWTDINRVPHILTFEDIEHIKTRIDRIHNELVPTIGDLIFNKYAIIRSQILLCSTKAEVDSIDIDQIYNYDTNNILEGLIEQFKLMQ